MKITAKSALDHLEALYKLNSIPKTADGDFVICHENGWFAQAPDEAAAELSEGSLKGIDQIRERLVELDGMSPVPELVISDYVVFFDTETEYGEPQAWIYLKDGTSLEITHEEHGLTLKDQYFSVRHHCSEEDFERDLYHSTMGVIETCTGGLDGISGMLDRICEKVGIAEDSYCCPVCGSRIKDITRDDDCGTTMHCSKCGCETDIFIGGSISIEGKYAASNASVSRRDKAVISLTLEMRDRDNQWTSVFTETTLLDHPVSKDDIRKYAAAGYSVAEEIYRRHNQDAITSEAEELLDTAMNGGAVQ